MASKNHIHKYYRLRDGLWHCALSDCTHYMPSNVSDSVPGKKSICWECEEPFILDPMNMQKDKPICLNCSLPNNIFDTDGNFVGGAK